MASLDQSNRPEFFRNEIVASSITLFSIVPKDGFPNKSRSQRVSSSILLILAISSPGTSESWSKRSLRSTSYRGQCRRKCLLFSLSLPQKQTGLRQSKACLKRCSFRGLNWTRSFVNSLTPEMSQILYVEFLIGLTIASNLFLK